MKYLNIIIIDFDVLNMFKFIQMFLLLFFIYYANVCQ